MTEEGSTPIGYAVVLASNLGTGRTLSFQFNFAQGASAATMNEELDKLASVFDRQVARASIEPRREELSRQKLIAEVIEQDIGRMHEQVAQIAVAGRDPARRNQVNTQQIETNIKAQCDALGKTKRSIEELEKIIADLEKKAA